MHSAFNLLVFPNSMFYVPNSIIKDVQCYELFGGIALKNHAFSFFHIDLIIP